MVTCRRITVDKALAYLPAAKEWQGEEALPQVYALRQSIYGNTGVGQNHRGVKRSVNPRLECGPCETAELALPGYDVMRILHTGQLETAVRSNVLSELARITRRCGMAASNIQQGVCTAWVTPIIVCN